MAGEAYAKRYGAGGFVDLPAQTTSIDSQYLNAVEAALARLLGADPTDKYVQVWDSGLGRFKTVPLTAANLDPAAGILKTQLAPLAITDADIAAGANISGSKLGGNISPAQLNNPGDTTQVLQGDGNWGVRRLFLGYSTRTSALSTSASTFATASNILGATVPFTADGSSDYLAVLSAGTWQNSSVSNNVLAMSFDGNEYNRIVTNMNTLGVPLPLGTILFPIIAPASGAHAVLFKLYVGGGTATLNAGPANAAGGPQPAFGGVMRI